MTRLPETSPRLVEAFRGERCWLHASQPRELSDVLDDVDGMIRYCRRLGQPPQGIVA